MSEKEPSYTIFGTFDIEEGALPENNAWLEVDPESGGFWHTFTVATPSRELLAKWDKPTGEMTLETREGVCVLATRNPDAFRSGAQLVGSGAAIIYLGWALVLVQDANRGMEGL